MRRYHPSHCTGSPFLHILSLSVLLCIFLLPPMPVSAAYVHLRLVEPDGLNEYSLSPDGKRIVYSVATDLDDERRFVALYSMPITGGRPVHLTQVTATERHDGLGFRVTPDSSRVIFIVTDYRKYDTVPCRDSLYSVPIAGGEPTRLDLPLSPEANKCIHWQISLDSYWVVYQETVENDTGDGYYQHLYSVPVTGGTPIRLNPAFGKDTGMDFGAYQITPDSAHVLFTTQGKEGEVYIAPVAGGKAVHFTCPQDLPSIDQVTVTADSQFGIAICRWLQLYEIYSFSIAEGTPVRLSGPYELQLAHVSYLLSSAGSTLAYRKWDDVAKVYRIVSVPVSGGAPTELATGDGPFQELTVHALTPDGSYLLYTQTEDSDTALYSTPTSQSAPLRLMDLPADWDWTVSLSPDGTQAILERNQLPEMQSTSSQRGQNVPALMSVPVTGGAVTVLVESDRYIKEWQFSHDEREIFFLADEGSLLRALCIDGGTPTLIAESVADFDITPDDKRIVYQTWDRGLFVFTPGSNQFLPSVYGP